MRQFKNKKEGYKTLRNTLLVLSVPSVLMACGFVYIIPTTGSVANQASNVNVFPYTMLLIIGIIAFSLFRSYKRQKVLFDSYTLTIDNESITREQYNTPTIRFSITDIRKITKTVKGAFVIQNTKTADYIVISADIEDKPELEMLLEKICEFTLNSPRPILRYLMIPLAIVMFVMMAILFASDNKILVGISGPLLTAFLVWSFIGILRNKNMDKKTKRSSYLVIIVILSVIGTTIAKLMQS